MSAAIALCAALLAVPLVPLEETAPSVNVEASGEYASHDMLGGGSKPGAWAVGFQGGWPWLGARAQVGLPGGLTPVIEVETALFRRVQPSIGVSGRLFGGAKGRLSGEALIGWQTQTGVLEHRGPSATARLRVIGIAGRVAPWFALGTRHTFLFDRKRIVRRSGETVIWSSRHRWSPHLAGGVAIGITKNVGIDVGLDWHVVDVGTVEVSLPGFHLGVQFGGGR